jgi:hypothetical protein
MNKSNLNAMVVACMESLEVDVSVPETNEAVHESIQAHLDHCQHMLTVVEELFESGMTDTGGFVKDSLTDLKNHITVTQENLPSITASMESAAGSFVKGVGKIIITGIKIILGVFIALIGVIGAIILHLFGKVFGRAKVASSAVKYPLYVEHDFKILSGNNMVTPLDALDHYVEAAADISFESIYKNNRSEPQKIPRALTDVKWPNLHHTLFSCDEDGSKLTKNLDFPTAGKGSFMIPSHDVFLHDMESTQKKMGAMKTLLQHSTQHIESSIKTLEKELTSTINNDNEKEIYAANKLIFRATNVFMHLVVTVIHQYAREVEVVNRHVIAAGEKAKNS